ncbi:hydantoinase B/oxoprolinase family protein [Amycolatopsis regifaucium]|uniref:Hydantoinase n=1 Tax=Amycolatopsis regifaucium TaxID=546365 RepID=A0A154MHW2_9PSEU|nr:hydantoinase B/oxoprolinase family protein [Amycolatopsis regifaucium]KZB83956.1 hydantoinase [Amycolatopsis regifaucium]OKA06603.1 hydantoinase [Amycolatopsis regifaucium]SFH21475.1 N-methylhydantoinase B [Amycolatopsis regifaucium]
MSVDPILVGVLGNRLHSILAEQQNALVNTAFSSVVRESLDLACAVFDSRGEMIGQSVGGTPGHTNAMATGMHHFVAACPPGTLEPGDVLLTNDPWQTAGQLNDITVATPVFLRGRLVAWFASCCHAPDIGGRLVSAEANEVFEEGLRLPIMKFLRAGEVNADLEAVIRANVRTPEETIGDLYAQITGNEVGAASLVRLLEEFALDSLDDVAAEIMNRSERALRDALAKLPDGTYTSELVTDGFDDEEIVLKVTVTIDGEDIHLDFGGSSPQSRRGINVVLNYTRAYASFAVKAAISPEVPHNAGSFRPVHVTAPAGSVLNCAPPAPVASRHLLGHFLPSLLITALHEALPGNALAHSADAVWMTIWRGADSSGEEFMLNVFQTGGIGARATKDGLNTTGFPSGLRSTPTEIIETMAPLIQRERVLRPDSGGAGRWRGGLGQCTSMAARGDLSWSVNGNVDRVLRPASGVDSGQDGAAGRFGLSGGADLPSKSRVNLRPDDAVDVILPGGGGYGDPLEREPEAVLADVVDGYVSVEAARELYGVEVTYHGDPEALVRLPEDYTAVSSRGRK